MNRTVAIIIPTYRPDDKFQRLMNMLVKQTYPIKEIIIVNTDKELFQKAYEESDFLNLYPHARILHIKKQDFDHGKSRNLGVQQVISDYFVCMTQDAVPVDEFLIENLLNAFDNKDVVISYGRQVTDENSSVVEAFTRNFNYPDKSFVKSKEDIKTLGIKAFFSSNVCAAYRKDFFDQLGGFIEPAIFNEDMIYAHAVLMADKKIAYQADAQVIHSHQYGFKQQFQRNFDLAVSQQANPQVFAGISSEKEGVRYVKKIILHLWNHKEKLRIPYFIMESGFKYLGYQAGLRYNRLPKGLIRRWTMNQSYWK